MPAATALKLKGLLDASEELRMAEDALKNAREEALRGVKQLRDLRSELEEARRRREEVKGLAREAGGEELVRLQIKLRGLEFKIVELGKEIFSLESRTLAKDNGFKRAEKKLEEAEGAFVRAMNSSREAFMRAAGSLDTDERTRREIRDFFRGVFVFRSGGGIIGGTKGDILVESAEGAFRAVREGVCVTFTVEEGGRVSILRAAETDETGNEGRVLYQTRA